MAIYLSITMKPVNVLNDTNDLYQHSKKDGT